MGELPENRLIRRTKESSISAAEISKRAGLPTTGDGSEVVTYDISAPELADAFTEWERRWREEPERFQEDSERLAGTSEEYGVGAARYLIEILGERRG